MSTEKLFSKYDQRTKNFFCKAKEIVAKGILLPPNAQLARGKQTQLRASLAEQNVDPAPIDRVRYCVDTIIEAGEEPRHRESIRAQLQVAKAQQPRQASQRTKSEPYADLP